MLKADFIIAGGGIVGLATAYQLIQKHPGKSLLILEKEDDVAKHQTGRNSGVIHSGIYYKPGSEKAKNCRSGKIALEQFCKDNSIPFDQVGKLIVATNKDEEDKLHDILSRGEQNGINCKLLTKKEMLAIEPNVTGVAAIHVPETGIVDYKQVSKCLAYKIRMKGGNFIPLQKIVKVENNNKNNIHIFTESDNPRLPAEIRYCCDVFINCGGLYADHIARASGFKPEIQIVPFRGEYYTLSPEAIPMVKGLIYPVPDPRFPFLGVHFTKMIGGGVECGPNAVLAFGRESYEKYQINFYELWETLTFPGFWKVAYKYWQTGISEMMRSLSKPMYTRSLKKLVPNIKQKHLLNNRPSGIRAQAVKNDGTLVDDFLIEKQGNSIHVLNAPSPAATACLSVGEQIISKL